MAYPDEAGALIVSLQDRAASGVPTAGHRGFGVLYGTDLAAIFVPPAVSWESAFDLEVLVVPTLPEPDAVVERLRCRHLELASLAGTPDSRVALIRLVSDSRYATEGFGLPPFDVVVDRLSEHPELIEGMVHLDLFPADRLPLDPAVVLAAVDVLEANQRLGLQVDRLGRRPGDIAACIFSPKCEVYPPRWRG